jgi:hypothetical protein
MNLSAGELKEITIKFGKENFESGPEIYLSDEDYGAYDSEREQEEEDEGVEVDEEDSPMSKAMA